MTGSELRTEDLARRETDRRDDGVDEQDARPAYPDEGSDDARARSEDRPSLLPGDESSTYQTRWTEIQTEFVDEPREAVEKADALVADLMRRLAETFADERRGLESQWSSGEEVSTEDLRVALQRYRSFFERLLAT
jgi:hypothetical protein